MKLAVQQNHLEVKFCTEVCTENGVNIFYKIPDAPGAMYWKYIWVSKNVSVR